MIEEINEYEKYLLNFGMVERPRMPKFNKIAYTDNEYLSALFESVNAFEQIDDEYLTIMHLKGEWWILLVATFIMQI